jgi:hypothetical protein
MGDAMHVWFYSYRTNETGVEAITVVFRSN